MSEQNQTEQEVLNSDDLEEVAGGATILPILIVCPGPIIEPCFPTYPGSDLVS